MQSLRKIFPKKRATFDERHSESTVGRIAPRLFWTGALIVGLGLVTGLVSWLSLSGTASRAVASVGETLTELSQSAGFTVEKVTLSGRRETSQEQVLAAVDVNIGDSMFGIDLKSVSDKLSSAGWVETVSVTRFWPNHLHLEVRERKPFALWQRDGAIALIDRSGIVIAEENLERFGHLPLLVGPNANERAGEIITLIDLEPSLMGRVRSATFIGQRRWNIRMDTGLDIKLPETGMEAAWHKIADLELRFGLLLRDLEAIDLRLPDRTIVKLPKGVAKRERRSGQST